MTLPALAALVIAGGCAGTPRPVAEITPLRHATGMADVETAARYVRSPRPQRFSVCHGNTCRVISPVQLDGGAWESVRRHLRPAAADAATERALVARAIARLEQLVGARTGTGADPARNDGGVSLDGRMDCVDEATNTSAYLLMLRDDGLLRWHDVGPRLSRGLLQGETLHFTATLVENATGIRYAVDSWFGPNGAAPHVVPLADWMGGWKPPTLSE